MHADPLVNDDLNVVCAQISTQDRNFRVFDQETGEGCVWHSINPGDDDRVWMAGLELRQGCLEAAGSSSHLDGGICSQ